MVRTKSSASERRKAPAVTALKCGFLSRRDVVVRNQWRTYRIAWGQIREIAVVPPALDRVMQEGIGRTGTGQSGLIAGLAGRWAASKTPCARPRGPPCSGA
jgi:hypothetical protein